MRKQWLCLLLAICLLPLCGVTRSEAADVFAGAKWIWTDTRENNEWVYLQRTFTLAEAPDTAAAFIAAADKYTLYVNGELDVLDGSLKRGPNPTDGWYDVIDLAPHLRAGENVIAVKAWYWGRREAEESTSHAFAAQAGFLFAMEAGGSRIVSDGSWRAYRELAYLTDKKSNPAPRSCLPEYNLVYDAAAGIGDGWLTQEADWDMAAVRAEADDPVYGALTERPIPLFAFGELTDFVDGEQWIGHRTARKEDITLRLPYNMQFTFCLKISDSRSRTITIQPNNYRQSKLGWKYISSGAGEQEYEFPAWLNGDSVTLSIPGGVTILALKYRPTGYDTQLTGRFSMGDAFFDELWTTGVRTQHVCMRDTFMDCPDRERAQWWGDTANQMEQTLYAMDGSAWLLYEKGLQQKLGWMHDGIFQTIVPSEENSELPIQELAGIVGTWQYYLHTGRVCALEWMFDAYVNYLLQWEMNDSGLVNIRPCRWAQETWYDAYAGEDAPVLENAWYYWAARSVLQMAGVLGREAPELAVRTASIAAAFDGAFWTEQGYRSPGMQMPDDRAQAIAVLSGLAGEARYPVILSVLQQVRQCGTFMEKYVLEAMCEMGYVSEALDRMAERYGPMIAFNQANHITTLWEYWERESGTENHAWSAGPVWLLPRYVGGVRPTAPGWEACVIAPDFSHSDRVSVTVSTVKGIIAVEGAARALEITLPEGVTAEVRLPGLEPRTVSGAGTHTIRREEP